LSEVLAVNALSTFTQLALEIHKRPSPRRFRASQDMVRDGEVLGDYAQRAVESDLVRPLSTLDPVQQDRADFAAQMRLGDRASGHHRSHFARLAQEVLAEAKGAVLPLVSHLDTLRWVFIALALAGIGVAVWARVDDWRKGRR
jgi:hypothetical protein